MKRILFAGESWTSHTTHVKGFDIFNTSVYEEGAFPLISVLEANGYEVKYMPNHQATLEFPFCEKELQEYDCIILSDIGANTLLLHPDTFSKSRRMPNRCQEIRKYVENGGSLLMIGGYMSFSGVDARAKYGHTDIADILPVNVLMTDDLMEHPEGAVPYVEDKYRAIFNIEGEIPYLLGYNKTLPKKDADIAMTICGDPLLAFIDIGKGKTAAFTSDCSPHWAPPEFVNWEGYSRLFLGIIEQITKR